MSQSNENSASATTAGDGAFIVRGRSISPVPFSLSIGLGSGFAASLSGSLDTSFDGGQDVDQVNVNAQLIAAASSAVAGDVSVSSDGYMSAGGIGINAVSAATAGAAVDNSVTQSNTNSLTASTQGDLELMIRVQEAVQANVNLQLLAAASEASSGNVAVESEGDTDAGGHGIIPASEAVAGANLDSSVSQRNTNSASATTAGDLTAIAQTQDWCRTTRTCRQPRPLPRRVRLGDGGSAGSLSSGGDGITATSSATAGANLNQSATQSNSNSASATLTAPVPQTRRSRRNSLRRSTSMIQDGAAIAAATSDLC